MKKVSQKYLPNNFISWDTRMTHTHDPGKLEKRNPSPVPTAQYLCRVWQLMI